jgi:hypothetical protein
LIGSHDLPLPGSRRSGDDEVVGATRRPRTPDVGQESGVGLSDIELIGLNRDGVENRGNEPLARISPAPFRQLNANRKSRRETLRQNHSITSAWRFGVESSTVAGRLRISLRSGVGPKTPITASQTSNA